jgi:hypothetical protein
MESASTTSPLAIQSIREMLARQPLTPAKVLFAWRVSAGPAFNRAARATFADGTLSIRVTSAAWRKEIERATPLLKERLGALLGKDIVRWIVVILDEGKQTPHA